MTSDADPHEEFEIAALRRAHGALDAEGVARLDEHLATCVDCCAFAATAAATADALRGRAVRSSASRDWTRIRSGLDARMAAVRRRFAARLAMTCALVAGCWWVKGFEWAVVVAGVSAVAMGGVFVFYTLPRERTARRAAQSDYALLVFYRTDLDQEIASLRASRAFVFLLGAIWIGLAVLFVSTAQDAWRDGRPYDPSFRILLLSANLVLVVLKAHRAWVVLPRLERERRDLE
jgi:hypothetical protein